MSDWHGLYRDGWQGLIVPDAFAHPAKVSRGLARKIYDHCREQGWLSPGDHVMDPFAGIGGFALDAMRTGCHWIGIELEAKFVALAEQNLALWHKKFHRLPNWGTARVYQGDSRKLLCWSFAGGQVEMVCGSPPYSEALSGNTNQTEKDRQHTIGIGRDPDSPGAKYPRMYSKNPSNLGNLPDKGFDAVVSSPPYAGSVNAEGHGIDWTKAGPATGNRKRGEGTKHEETLRGQLAYGQTRGQLGALPEGRVEAVVSSPPYEAALSNPATSVEHTGAGGPIHPRNYGESEYNLGNSSGDTFWLASRQILDQVFLVIRPGGHAVFVVKDFVRKGKIVPFSNQWRQLSEAVGFVTVHQHRAWLVEDNGTQGQVDGGETRLVKERKSFFRRLAERKGSPRLDWETVWCLKKRQ